MAERRFVRKKGLGLGVKGIVVMKKMEKGCAGGRWVMEERFELLEKLGAREEELELGMVYGWGVWGFGKLEEREERGKMGKLKAILEWEEKEVWG